jgi:WD40 repeat protein
MNKKEIIEMEVIRRDIANTKEKVKDTIRYWQNVLDELDRRAAEYEKMYMNMKEEEEEDRRKRDEVELNIKLNLRGQVFNTTKDILVKGSTYFNTLLSSPLFELDVNGEFFIDRYSNGFDRILDYMSTGVLSTEGLNRYDEDCVYDNLKYFMIPHKSRWNYSKVSLIEGLKFSVLLQLKDGRLCGYQHNYDDYDYDYDDLIICIYNMDTNIMEQTLIGHTEDICAIIQLEDGRLCSCSEDKTIKLWNIQSGQCERTIEGHNDGVTRVIQLMDGRLCSGSYDGYIRVWNTYNGVCELCINTAASMNCLVQLRNGRVCCGQFGGSIKVWSIGTGVCEMTLNGHTDDVTAIVVIDERRIYSCAGHKTIRVWNISTGVCERIWEGHKGSVLDTVLLLDGRVCSVYNDGGAKIWNTDSGVCELSIQVNKSSIYRIVQLHDGQLVFTSRNDDVYMIG